MDTPSSTSYRAVLLAIALCVAMVGGVAAPAAADDIGAAVTDSDDEPGMFQSFMVASAENFNNFRQFSVDVNPLREAETTADEQADAVQETFNDDSADWVEWYASQGYPATDEVEVIELRFDDGDDVAERYLIAEYDANSGEYTTAEIVDDTDRDVDEWVEVDGPLVATVDSVFESRQEAADLVEDVHDQFVEPNKHIGADRSFLRSMATDYAGHVDVSERLDPATSIADEGGD